MIAPSGNAGNLALDADVLEGDAAVFSDHKGLVRIGRVILHVAQMLITAVLLHILSGGKMLAE